MTSLILTKRNNVWQYRFEIAKQDGQRKYFTKSGFRTKKEAREAGLKALVSYQSTSFIPQKDISYSDYLDLWFKSYCTIFTKFNTQIHHSRIILKHIKPMLGDYKLQNITASILQDFVNALLLAGTKDRYVREIFAIVIASLNYAVHPLKMLVSNPAKEVRLPKAIRKVSEKRYVISYTDFQKILREFPIGSPARIPLLLGYHAGMRMGEVFGLSWNDIDLEHGIIHIQNNAIHKHKESKALKYMSKQKSVPDVFGWYLSTPKTKGSIREIPIDKILLSELKETRAYQKSQELLLGNFYTIVYKQQEGFDTRLVEVEKNVPVLLKSAELVCIDEYGKYLSWERFKKYSKIIQEKLKINFNFHSLRHTHATILVQQGAAIKDVQERLGHSKIDTTLEIYVHNSKENQTRTIKLFADHLAQFKENGVQKENKPQFIHESPLDNSLMDKENK